MDESLSGHQQEDSLQIVAQAPQLSPTSFALPPPQDLPQTHQIVEPSHRVVKVEWMELALAMVMDSLALRYVAVLQCVASISTLVPALAKRALFPIPLLAVMGRQPVSARRDCFVDTDASHRLLMEETSARVDVKEVDFPVFHDWSPHFRQWDSSHRLANPAP